MRRPLLIGASALWVLFGVASSAQAADVTVRFGGATKTVSLGSLAPDVNSSYELVGADRTTTKQISGISLRALLKAAGAELSYRGVTVSRPGGKPVRLSRTQIDASGAGPVVYEDGGLATFLRPSYFPSDQNAKDVISVSSLVVSVSNDAIDYGLKAKVSKSKTKPGELLRFSASANGAAGQKLEYRWNFDDGGSDSGARVSHRFKKRGFYRVLVTVRGEGEKSSSSIVLRVQVGSASKSDKKREGGGTNDSPAAPLSGQAEGPGGDGDFAGDQQQPSDRPKKRDRRRAAPSELTPVTGELLEGVATPQPQSDLAARSGGQATAKGASAGVPTEAAGAAVALGLLAMGAALEMGGAGALRRRFLS